MVVTSGILIANHDQTGCHVANVERRLGRPHGTDVCGSSKGGTVVLVLFHQRCCFERKLPWQDEEHQVCPQTRGHTSMLALHRARPFSLCSVLITSINDFSGNIPSFMPLLYTCTNPSTSCTSCPSLVFPRFAGTSWDQGSGLRGPNSRSQVIAMRSGEAKMQAVLANTVNSFLRPSFDEPAVPLAIDDLLCSLKRRRHLIGGSVIEPPPKPHYLDDEGRRKRPGDTG